VLDLFTCLFSFPKRCSWVVQLQEENEKNAILMSSHRPDTLAGGMISTTARACESCKDSLTIVCSNCKQYGIGNCYAKEGSCQGHQKLVTP
jgi:hypothetical protein